MTKTFAKAIRGQLGRKSGHSWVFSGVLLGLLGANLNNGGISVVKADQPVHCLRESVYGTWDFHVSKDVGNVNLFEAKEVCTHQLPNKLQMLSEGHEFAFADEEVWKMSLMDQYQVQASNDGGKTQVTGRWSPIYA